MRILFPPTNLDVVIIVSRPEGLNPLCSPATTPKRGRGGATINSPPRAPLFSFPLSHASFFPLLLLISLPLSFSQQLPAALKSKAHGADIVKTNSVS